MANRKVCRVCGASYEACNSARRGGTSFNWREVACSPECGMTYLNRIAASRGNIAVSEQAVATESAVTATAKTSRKKAATKYESVAIVETEPIAVETDVVVS